MTPDERLELLLGQGADDGASSAPPSAGGHEGGPLAVLGELEAIATALGRLELPVPSARSAALRAHLEVEAARLSLPPAAGGDVGGGPLPRSWLPWVGGILLLTSALWLAQHPSATGRRGGPREADAPARADEAAVRTGPAGRATAGGDQGVGWSTPAVVEAATLTVPLHQDDAPPPLADRIATAALPRSPQSMAGIRVAPRSTAGPGEGRGAASNGAATAPPSGDRAAAGLGPPRVWDGYLRGRVTDGGGRAIAAAEVTAYRQDRPGLFVQRAGADGRYAILLPRGRYRLEARASGFARRWFRQAASAEAAAILQWDVDTPDIVVDFALPSASSPAAPGG